jgi:predicted transcriptional regulator of viral defense system
MSFPTNLQSVLTQNNGTITTKEANRSGISNERLRLLVRSGELERLARGVYSLPENFIDNMFVYQLSRPSIIYSHETALFLHNLTDRDPVSYSVTVPTGYGVSRLLRDGLSVFTVKRQLFELGVSEVKTVFGNTIRAYNLERTICDCVRSRKKMDVAIVSEALKRYSLRSDKNLNTLMEMAKIFRITTPLRPYLEVLL